MATAKTTTKIDPKAPLNSLTEKQAQLANLLSELCGSWAGAEDVLIAMTGDGSPSDVEIPNLLGEALVRQQARKFNAVITSATGQDAQGG